MPALEENENVTSWPASKARHQFRTNPYYEGKSTSGFCMRHVQTNLAILPAALADEFERFCNLNKAPCPLMYKSRPGELSAGYLAQNSDVRYEKSFVPLLIFYVFVYILGVIRVIGTSCP